MTTFHLFPRLPAELRIRIWEMTVEPRLVDVREGFRTALQDSNEKPMDMVPYLCSSTPVPATLQTCREARKLKLYERFYLDLIDHDTSNMELQHIWLNLKIDMISIGRNSLHFIAALAEEITRLRFECRDACEIGLRCRDLQLMQFENLKEIHMVCPDGCMENQWRPIESYVWPCGPENAFLVSSMDGSMVSFTELKQGEEEEKERLDKQFELMLMDVLCDDDVDIQGPSVSTTLGD